MSGRSGGKRADTVAELVEVQPAQVKATCHPFEQPGESITSIWSMESPQEVKDELQTDTTTEVVEGGASRGAA